MNEQEVSTPTTDPVLREMRDAAAEYGTTISIERVLFGPNKHAVRIKRGRKAVGPLLFPAKGQTIGHCLDQFLSVEATSDGE